MAIAPDEFRAVLGRFASGVTVLTARDAQGHDHGMTVSAFCSVSLDPPLVLACIDRKADMLPLLKHATHFGISILAENQELVSRRFAELPEGRFEDVGFSRGDSGAALLDDAIAHLECRLIDQCDGGDHAIFVARVEAATSRPGRPLLYYRGGYAQMAR